MARSRDGRFTNRAFVFIDPPTQEAPGNLVGFPGASGLRGGKTGWHGLPVVGRIPLLAAVGVLGELVLGVEHAGRETAGRLEI